MVSDDPERRDEWRGILAVKDQMDFLVVSGQLKVVGMLEFERMLI